MRDRPTRRAEIAAYLAAGLLAAPVLTIAATVDRPAITGIAGVRILVSDIASARAFYSTSLGLPEGTAGNCPRATLCLTINGRQTLQVTWEGARGGAAEPTGAAPESANRIARVTFATTDVGQMRRFLQSKGIAAGPITRDPGGARHFDAQDPESHGISFLQYPENRPQVSPRRIQTSTRLLDAGFIVRSREAQDRFYRDVLGFHLYWQGGLKDGDTSWVSMQVPDGSDWLEYMLNAGPAADSNTRGALNHVAFGVANIEGTRRQLIDNGLTVDGKARIGRDGKWQLSLHDTDGTRVEFMEFNPVEAPCCSRFTGVHPGPADSH